MTRLTAMGNNGLISVMPAIVRALPDIEGEVAGSVSGGCVEGAVVGEALAILAGEASPRIVPATRSKRNKRHSIGPFHIGVRRDSFSRIAPGSFMSGLSTQAVQPAGWRV